MASSVPVVLDDLGVAAAAGPVAETGNGSRFRSLAFQAAGEGTLLERLKNIRRFLRDNYRYSLITENPRNLDPLENFLFEEKRGHCEFFATAGALTEGSWGLRRE